MDVLGPGWMRQYELSSVWIISMALLLECMHTSTRACVLRAMHPVVGCAVSLA